MLEIAAGRMLALLLLTGAAVALVVWIVLRVTRQRPPAGTAVFGARPDAALEELRLRYARGEVDRDSFRRAASDLGAPAVPGPPGSPASVAPDDATPR